MYDRPPIRIPENIIFHYKLPLPTHYIPEFTLQYVQPVELNDDNVLSAM